MQHQSGQPLFSATDLVNFQQKCDNVFELVVDYASRGRKWAA